MNRDNLKPLSAQNGDSQYSYFDVIDLSHGEGPAKVTTLNRFACVVSQPHKFAFYCALKNDSHSYLFLSQSLNERNTKVCRLVREGKPLQTT